MSHGCAKRAATLSLVLLSILGAWCSSAAAQIGLPRTYDAVRVDSPTAGAADAFGFEVINGGDLNGDSIDDILAPQGTRIPGDGAGAENGEVLVISGADGSVIRTIAAPEPETASGTGLTENRSAAFGFYVGSIGRNSAVASAFTDLSSCPGGNTDADPFCDAAAVGPPDGIPDIVASALFVDRTSGAATDGVAEDIGRVYVIDGATFTVVKRLDMPQADVDDMADETERLSAASPLARARPWFGRTVLNPMGQTPCAGNFGVGACTPPTPIGVTRGDLNGGGLPDVVVGSSAYKYEEAEGTNPACDDTPAVDTCIRSGRAYMYRGEDIAGTGPDTTLSTPAWNIVNPYAQADNPETRVVNQLELFGHSVAPVGDVGACTGVVAPGAFCPAAQVSGTADGKPDVLISAFRVDYPTSGPDTEEDFDVGVNLMIDGATGAIVQTYRHPDAQKGSIFGFTVTNQPAVGNGGGTITPDIFIPANGQDTDEYRGEGTGFLMNGATLLSGNVLNLERFRPPTPAAHRGFGTSASGVGNLVGGAENEILIGEFAGDVDGEVAFFSTLTGKPLQTIADPDAQRGSTFGISLAPLGDINGDTYLDFAVGASGFDRAGVSNIGRIYIMRSNNTPLPPPPPPPPPVTGPPGAPGAPGAPGTPGGALSGRALELVAAQSSVARGRSVRLNGTLEAFANEARCQAGQTVEIQRRTGTTSRYTTIASARTAADGSFSSSVLATRSAFVRARIAQDAACLGAVSQREQIQVAPSVRLVSQTARLTAAGAIRLQVDCRTDDRPCNGTVKLRTVARVGGRQITLPTASFQAPGNARRSVTVSVGSRTAALLRRVRSRRMLAFVVGRDARGNSTTIEARVTIRTR